MRMISLYDHQMYMLRTQRSSTKKYLLFQINGKKIGIFGDKCSSSKANKMETLTNKFG